MVTKLIHYLILSCCKATLLMEKKEANTISSMEKIRLHIHLRICKWCRAYNKKMAFIEKMMGKIGGDAFNDMEISQFKVRMVQKLEE